MEEPRTGRPQQYDMGTSREKGVLCWIPCVMMPGIWYVFREWIIEPALAFNLLSNFSVSVRPLLSLPHRGFQGTKEKRILKVPFRAYFLWARLLCHLTGILECRMTWVKRLDTRSVRRLLQCLLERWELTQGDKQEWKGKHKQSNFLQRTRAFEVRLPDKILVRNHCLLFI